MGTKYIFWQNIIHYINRLIKRTSKDNEPWVSSFGTLLITHNIVGKKEKNLSHSIYQKNWVAGIFWDFFWGFQFCFQLFLGFCLFFGFCVLGFVDIVTKNKKNIVTKKNLPSRQKKKPKTKTKNKNNVTQ